MADITMCDGLNCPKASECYRHTAQQNKYRQSFFIKTPMDSTGLCKEYIDNGKSSQQNDTGSKKEETK